MNTATSIYKQGYAIGQSDIRADCLHFRFYDEYFVLTSRNVRTKRMDGFMVAKIEDVRKASRRG